MTVPSHRSIYQQAMGMGKKSTAITAGLLCIISIASAQSVISGTFGFQKVDIPPAGDVNLVGFSFSSDQPIYLEDVFGTNQLTQGVVPSLADTLYIWNGSSYDFYFQKADGLFYDGSNPFGASVTSEIAPGTALFLQSPSSAAMTNTITLSGSVLMADFELLSYDGLLTIANPYPTKMDLNSLDFDWSEATPGVVPSLADIVYIWNPDKTGGAGYESFFIKSDGKWHEITSPFALGNAVIPLGGGAFYQAKNTFTNEVVRPFSVD